MRLRLGTSALLYVVTTHMRVFYKGGPGYKGRGLLFDGDLLGLSLTARSLESLR